MWAHVLITTRGQPPWVGSLLPPWGPRDGTQVFRYGGVFTWWTIWPDLLIHYDWVFHVWVTCMYVLHVTCVCGGQRTTFRNQFSPPTWTTGDWTQVVRLAWQLLVSDLATLPQPTLLFRHLTPVALQAPLTSKRPVTQVWASSHKWKPVGMTSTALPFFLCWTPHNGQNHSISRVRERPR